MRLLSKVVVVCVLASLCLSVPARALAQQRNVKPSNAKEATKEEQADLQRKPYHDAWWTNHHDFLVTRRTKQKEGKEWYLEATKEEKAAHMSVAKPWHDHWWTNHHRFLVTRQDAAARRIEWKMEPPKEDKAK